MSGSFVPTGSFTNLTRLEMEQLRKADFGVAGKALTTGDATGANADVNAELFATEPSVSLASIQPITPPTSPGDGLLTLSQVALSASGYSLMASETVQWYGPRLIASGSSGYGSSTTQWTTVTDMSAAGVQAGDILLVKTKSGATTLNGYATATISSLASGFVANLSNIRNPSNTGSPTQIDGSSTDPYQWLIVRPGAVQLYAIPGSGPPGQEQAYMFVKPVAQNTGVHALGAIDPTVLATLNTQRIRNIVAPTFGASPTNRSDAVYTLAGSDLSQLGYRVIFYPDDGSGTAPDLTNPIAAISPLVDGTSVPSTDQRVTVDYAAGIVRFSTPPTTTGSFKRGVAPTTRMNLYATFWAADLSQTAGAADNLYHVRSTNSAVNPAARVYWNEGAGNWILNAAAVAGVPSSLPGPTLDTNISSIVAQLNNAQAVALMEDPAFQSTTQEYTNLRAVSANWLLTPSDTTSGGAGFWKQTGSGISLIIDNSSASSVPFVQQNIGISVRPGEIIKWSFDLRRLLSTATSNTTLQLEFSFNLINGGTYIQTIADQGFINLANFPFTADPGFLTWTGSFTIPAGENYLAAIAIRSNNPISYSVSTSTTVMTIDNFQSYLVPASQLDPKVSYRRETGVRSQVRWNLSSSNLATQDDALLSMSGTEGGTDQVLTLGRADGTETLSHIAPSFAVRGTTILGAGVRNPTVPSKVNILQDIASDLSNASSARKLISETRTSANSYVVREYAVSGISGNPLIPTGSQDSVAYERTINAKWSQTLGRWVTDITGNATLFYQNLDGAVTYKGYGASPGAVIGDAHNNGITTASVGHTAKYTRIGVGATWTSGSTVITLAGGYPHFDLYPAVQVGDIVSTSGTSSANNYRYQVTAVTGTTITIGADTLGLSLPTTLQDNAGGSGTVSIFPVSYFRDVSTNVAQYSYAASAPQTITGGLAVEYDPSVVISQIQAGDILEVEASISWDMVGGGGGAFVYAFFGLFIYQQLNSSSATKFEVISPATASGTWNSTHQTINVPVAYRYTCSQADEFQGSLKVTFFGQGSSSTPVQTFVVNSYKFRLIRKE